MRVAAFKLIDVAARAVFTVGATFGLPLEGVGRWGILVTLIALFSFAFGWERHIDLQRRLVGEPDHVFDAGAAAALRLYAFNWGAMLPFFWLSAGIAAGLDATLLLAATVIVIGEQLASQLYNITLVQPRYWAALLIATVKNVAVALFVFGALVLAPSTFTFELAVIGWAIASALGTVAMAIAWRRVHARPPATETLPKTGIFAQHRASFHHFLIGLLAVLILQFDRLAVGTLLPAATAGIYFRHALLVSFVYQMFNILSYNRLVPRLFSAAKTADVPILAAMVRRELAVVATILIAGFAAALAIDVLTRHAIAERFSLDIVLGGLLVLGAIIRIAADLHAMILHALIREQALFRHQLVAFIAGVMVLVVLTLRIGITGAAVATIASALVYFALNRWAVHRASRPPLAVAAPSAER